MRRSTVLPALLAIALLMAAIPAAPQKTGVEMSERDRWAADLDYLAKELPTRHTNLFFKIASEKFQADVAALKARIPKLGRAQFLAEMARLVAGVGDSSILDPFIGELAAANEINRKGRLFVVVGRRTFSSAILNALDLRKKTEAVFYGEPTGGKPDHYGEIQTLTLPHLGLEVSYSTKYFQHAEGDEPSLIPDVPIELTLDDYLALRDPVLDAILAGGALDPLERLLDSRSEGGYLPQRPEAPREDR